MAFANFDAWLTQLENEQSVTTTTTGTVTASRLHDVNQTIAFSSRGTVTVPTSPVTCDKTNPGAINAQLANYSPNSAYVLGGRFSNGLTRGSYILIDRLSHQGGLDGTLTTAQTTNLPTAALTRYTNGVGVMAAIVIYTAIGATASTFTVSYTNQAGVAGQTSVAHIIGSSSYNAGGRLIPIPLANGDTGIRSVESVTLSATTGTAGNFGIVLFRPIAMFAIDTLNPVVADLISGCSAGGLEPISDDACLNLLQVCETGGLVSIGVQSFFFGQG